MKIQVAIRLTRTFYQTGPALNGEPHECWNTGSYNGNPVYTAGLCGRWRSFCGIFAPPLRANRPCYWLGAGCANLSANRLAIIPQSGEISGLT